MNKVELLNPTIDHIISEIENNSSISMVRLTSEWWMMANRALRAMGNNDDVPESVDDFIDTWSEYMHIEFVKQCGKRNWHASDKVYAYILKRIFTEELPENLLIGADYKPMSIDDTPLMELKLWFEWLEFESTKHMIEKLNLRQKAITSTIWRRYALNGDIDIFLNKMKHHQIVVVGPWYFENFDKKANLPHYKHIKIDENKAMLHVDDIERRMLEHHNEHAKDFEKIIYLCCGGMAVVDPILKLHNKLENAVMLDVGMSIQVYYYSDPVRHNSPKCFWGTWLDVHTPEWIKK